MSYTLLGQDLHYVGDGARKWFREKYGAKGFRCEDELLAGLPLRPTWQATLSGGYVLCVNVQPTPFSESLHSFVTTAHLERMPVKLWVAVPADGPKDSFARDMHRAHSLGIGLLQVPVDEEPKEYNRAVSLSVFGLAHIQPKLVPTQKREVVRDAEDTFLDGSPDQGCQLICQELEAITRRAAETTFRSGMWTVSGGAPNHSQRFFHRSAWANVLREFERSANVKAITRKSPRFDNDLIVRARAHTRWRNELSHKPKTLKQLRARDDKLRPMFEVTRDLLVEWFHAAKPLGLLKEE